MNSDIPEAGFLDRLRRGDYLPGCIITLDDAAASEALIDAGCQWLFVDREHALLSDLSVINHSRAATDRAGIIARVPQSEPGSMARLLDGGVDGLIVPQVTHPDQVREFVSRLRYPPAGHRGTGVGRSCAYGKTITSTLDQRPAAIVQIETLGAFENLDEILEISGLDGVFAGPYDLSVGLGKPGQPDHPVVEEAILKIAEAARRNGLICGLFTTTVDRIKYWQDAGYSLFAMGVDTMLLRQAWHNTFATFR